MKIPHRVALGVAYANSAFSGSLGENRIPVEGVKIAQHMMFVDTTRAQRELGFMQGSVTAALATRRSLVRSQRLHQARPRKKDCSTYGCIVGRSRLVRCRTVG